MKRKVISSAFDYYKFSFGFGGASAMSLVFAYLLASQAKLLPILLATPVLVYALLMSFWFFNNHIYLWIREDYDLAYKSIFFEGIVHPSKIKLLGYNRLFQFGTCTIEGRKFHFHCLKEEYLYLEEYISQINDRNRIAN